MSKIYKGGKVSVEDVNLSFEKGEIISFIGKSGIVKTTTMRMINRMNDPTQVKI
ncbi:ATP-binding cassette domain-containing protein, partial [Enterococcus faecium]|uniref:ATP-binding cassette domain-containing protein n=1 Tax=Enterococcus faecium TaxID=1352 RepID=UPI003907F10D